MCFTCFPLSRSRGGTSVLFLSFVKREKGEGFERWATKHFQMSNRFWVRSSLWEENFCKKFQFYYVDQNISKSFRACFSRYLSGILKLHSCPSVFIDKKCSHQEVASSYKQSLFFCRWQSLTPEMIMKRWCNSIRVVRWPKRAIKTLKGGP